MLKKLLLITFTTVGLAYSQEVELAKLPLGGDVETYSCLPFIGYHAENNDFSGIIAKSMPYSPTERLIQAGEYIVPSCVGAVAGYVAFKEFFRKRPDWRQWQRVVGGLSAASATAAASRAYYKQRTQHMYLIESVKALEEEVKRALENNKTWLQRKDSVNSCYDLDFFQEETKKIFDEAQAKPMISMNDYNVDSKEMKKLKELRNNLYDMSLVFDTFSDRLDKVKQRLAGKDDQNNLAWNVGDYRDKMRKLSHFFQDKAAYLGLKV